jgi:hypothetical protein
MGRFFENDEEKSTTLRLFVYFCRKVGTHYTSVKIQREVMLGAEP